MHELPIANGNGWTVSRKQAGWSSPEIDEHRRRTGWLAGWASRWGDLREGRRRTSRHVSSITRETAFSRAKLMPELPTSTVRFILLCSLWYMSSAMSSNTGKAILNHFRYPVTLTFVQFGFVAGYCLLFMSPVVRISKLRRPTTVIIRNTAPMAVFQVGGHIFSSFAIARIPVSTVHTIKVCTVVHVQTLTLLS
jgi:solute carrier family 35, member E1